METAAEAVATIQVPIRSGSGLSIFRKGIESHGQTLHGGLITLLDSVDFNFFFLFGHEQASHSDA